MSITSTCVFLLSFCKSSIIELEDDAEADMFDATVFDVAPIEEEGVSDRSKWVSLGELCTELAADAEAEGVIALFNDVMG